MFLWSTALRFEPGNCKFLLPPHFLQEARRPYDVKDVIEQYTAGQMEMFGYIKKLQSRYFTKMLLDP